MSTDIIFKKLQEKAEKALKADLMSAGDAYNKALKLAGTCELIRLESKQGVVIEMYTTDIYKAIATTLFEKRKEAYVREEVNNFINSVSSLSDQFELLKELNL